MRSLGGTLFWYKCVGSIKVLVNVKDKAMQEVQLLDFMRQRDPFLLLKKGMWGLMLDLSVGQQMAPSEAMGVPSIPRQKVQRGKLRR